MITNKYDEAEAKGRDIFLSAVNGQALTEGKTTDFWDFSGSTMTENYYVEVKYRPTTASTDFKYDFLESDKLDSIRNIDRKAIIYYAMVFNDGIMRVHNINNIRLNEIYVSLKDCPVSTTEPHKGTREKIVMELPAVKAKTIFWK